MKKYLILFLTPLLINNSIFSQAINGSFLFQGNPRTYIVYVPASYSSVTSLPLVIVYHGVGGNQNGIMGMTGFNAIADTANFMVAYPTALPYNSVNTWNIGGINPGVDDVGFTSALIDTLKANYPKITLCKVYATGFSMGSGMVQQLACDLTSRIASIASVAGGVPLTISGTCAPSRSISVFNMKGTTDNYNGNSIELGAQQTIDYWNQKNFCNLTAVQTTLPNLVNDGYTVDRFDYTPCSSGTENVLYRINNGPHAWIGSGANNGLNDINTSVEVWNFLKKYSNPAVNGCMTSDENEKNQSPKMSVDPNPSTGDFSVDYVGVSGRSHVNIYDSFGRKIYSCELENRRDGKLSINISEFPSGFYFLFFFSGNSVQTKKIIVQK